MRYRGIVRTLLLSSVAAGVVLGGAHCSSSNPSGSDDAGVDSGTIGSGMDGSTSADSSNAADSSSSADSSTGVDSSTGSDASDAEASDSGNAADAADANASDSGDPAASYPTATKIKHIVVIFGENVSFDHYFGTYPLALNPDAGGDSGPPFVPATGTPQANNLLTPLDPANGFAPAAIPDGGLLTANPTAANAGNNTSVAPAEGSGGAVNPFRLGPESAATSDMDHNYMPEQEADDKGSMDLFPRYTGVNGPPPDAGSAAATNGLVMAYFDGNTLSAFWGYAQSYSLNDNAWTSQFGPSTPGAINLISGQTNGIGQTNHTPLSSSHAVADGNGGLTLIGDIDPLGDTCSNASDQGTLTGKNVGDLLNAQGISWGWFQGGFDLTVTNANSTTGCERSSTGIASTTGDYVQHHEPFQYYATTANPSHARPSDVAAIGHTLAGDGGADPANHQYDSHDFFDALSAGNFPAVSYLKAPAYQDGHPGYSDPIDEQNFAAQVVSAVQASPYWDTTAIIITYDDSDGWYDHQAPPIVNPSQSVADALNIAPPTDGGPGLCNTAHAQQGDGGVFSAALLGSTDGGPAPQGRCGYGTRIPLLVISPYAKKNFIDHTLVDQSSVLKFVEDNWLSGQRIDGSFDAIAGSIENMFSF